MPIWRLVGSPYVVFLVFLTGQSTGPEGTLPRAYIFVILPCLRVAFTPRFIRPVGREV